MISKDGLLPPDTKGLDFPLLLSGEIQRVGPDEVIMYEPRWDDFFESPLEKSLRNLQINTLVIAGCNFPNCPRATIYEASERDFKVVAAKGCVSGLYDLGMKERGKIGGELLGYRLHYRKALTFISPWADTKWMPISLNP